MSEAQPRFLVGLPSAVIAAALIVYGALYLLPAWRFADAEPHYEAVARGRLGTAVELDALARALRGSPMRGDLNRAAFVQVVNAQRMGLKSQGAALRIFAARKDLHQGLGISPSDSLAWTRLAIAEHVLGDRNAAASALSTALQIAPTERRVLALQLDLALLLWPELDQPGRSAVARRLAHMSDRALTGNSAKALREKLALSGSHNAEAQKPR